MAAAAAVEADIEYEWPPGVNMGVRPAPSPPPPPPLMLPMRRLEEEAAEKLLALCRRRGPLPLFIPLE